MYLRKLCIEQLRGVELPHALTIEEICLRISVKRGRPLHLHQLPELGGVNAPCGVIVSFDSGDHIFHAAATSERHREQIIRHELAHYLLEHNGNGLGGGDLVGALLAALPAGVEPEAVLSVLGRTSYDTEQERDAELAASILGELFQELAVSDLQGRDARLERLDDAFAYPRKDRRS
ncbi:secondary metabolite protein [Streptomyces sp. 21So2-11]|uniref:secondary metabolite protein n=1 Tax=Streptomyces sp. 21So2-11 TaxID=3144408 RepID=UPI003219E576